MRAKTCTKCKGTFPLSKYRKKSDSKDGYATQCGDCQRIAGREYRNAHLKQERERTRIWSNSSPKAKIGRKRWADANKEKIKEYRLMWAKDNAGNLKQYKHKYYERNKERLLSQSNKRYYEDKKERNAKALEYYHRVLKHNTEYRLKQSLRSRIYSTVFKGYKSDSTEELLGCSIPTLIKQIEELFEQGMSWDNYGMYGWHIDHIKPCCLFNLLDPVEQKECFNHANLQPLWSKDNLHKYNKHEVA